MPYRLARKVNRASMQLPLGRPALGQRRRRRRPLKESAIDENRGQIEISRPSRRDGGYRRRPIAVGLA